MKMFKRKIGMVAVALAMMFVGVFGVAGVAGATSKTTPMELSQSNFLYAGTAYIHTSESPGKVHATMEMAMDTQSYVKFELWARYAGGTWSVISTRYGGLATNSWGYKKNANVTFDNIGYYGREMKVRVYLYNQSNYTQFIQSGFSYTWWR